MKLITKSVQMAELRIMSKKTFGGLVKAVVDVEKEVMVVDAGMHADQERLLIERGSKQDSLWGINLYPEFDGDEFIEFDSMINLRPRLNNFSRSLKDKKLRQRIRNIVNKLVKK